MYYIRIHVIIKYIGTRHEDSKISIFEMSLTIEERTSCVLWFTEPESIVTTQRTFVHRFGIKITQPFDKSLRNGC